MELTKTMIFAVPLKTKNSSVVEVVIKEIVLYVERKLKYKVERIHTDPGSELQTKSLRSWCADNGIRKTVSIPEDFKGNGSAESAVGLVKRQTRAALSESKLAISYWPFAASYAAKQRERLALKEPPLLKFGCNVIVKKRISNNRKVKGFEKIGQVGKYLGPLRNSHDGHFVLLEDQKVLKTTRIVPYDLQEQESEERDLEELGWTWMTDPEGRTFYLNKNTGEKSWDTPMRFKEIEEQPEIPEDVTRRRLN